MIDAMGMFEKDPKKQNKNASHWIVMSQCDLCMRFFSLTSSMLPKRENQGKVTGQNMLELIPPPPQLPK